MCLNINLRHVYPLNASLICFIVRLFILITHRVARHCNERALHGRCNRNHVVDNAFILRVGDICDAEDVPHGVGQPLQTATRLVSFGHK